MSVDFASLLKLDDGNGKTIAKVSRAAMRDDGTLDVYYAISADMHVGASKWLRDNQLVISDITIGGTEVEGTWRTIKIEAQEQRTRSGDSAGGVLIQTFAKGYYKQWNWEACRVDESSLSHGNANAIAGITAASSALFQRVAVLTLPYVDPLYSDAISETLTALSYVDLSAGGITFDDTWAHLGVKVEPDNDGTHKVSLTLGKLVYNVEGYRGYGTWEKEQQYAISGVPLANVQTVIDAWKTVGGKGANASMSGTSGSTASITLSRSITTAKADQRTTSKEDCFSTVTSATALNQAAAGTKPADVVGINYATENTETPEGKFNVTQSVDTAKIGDTGENIVELQHDGTTIKARSARHLDPSSLPSWADAPTAPLTVGKAVQIRKEKNQYCGLSVNRSERTVTEVRRPAAGDTPYETKDGTVHVVEYDYVSPTNLADRLKALDAYTTHNVSAPFTYDPSTGTYSIRLRATPSIGTGDTLAPYSETEDTTNVIRKQTGAGLVVRQMETYSTGWLQTTSKAAAIAFIKDQQHPFFKQFKRGSQTYYSATYSTLKALGNWTTAEDQLPTA